MTDEPANRILIPEPQTYHADWYELLGRAMQNAPTSFDTLGEMFYRANIPMGGTEKQDWNNAHTMSLDFVGGNVGFVTTDYAARDAIIQNHNDYTLGLFKFLREDTRVPAAFKTAMADWGFCADEFVEDGTGGLSPELYVRESARMVGDYVMTEANFFKTANAANPIAHMSYAMDSHATSRRVVGGATHSEGGLSSELTPVGYYGFEYRALLSKATQCGNLLASCNGISASHSVFGSIRMEVTFMSLGEAAGAAAALALTGHGRLHDIAGSDLQPIVRPYEIDPSRILTLADPTTNGTASWTNIAGWTTAIWPPEFYDTALWNELNGNKGGRYVQFNPTFSATGRYRILLNAPGSTNSQLLCKVDVVHADGTETFYIDHKFGEWHFRELGVWRFLDDGSCYIRVTNSTDPTTEGANSGIMSVDGVAWHLVP
jgi:hypothetical protein